MMDVDGGGWILGLGCICGTMWNVGLVFNGYISRLVILFEGILLLVIIKLSEIKQTDWIWL